MKVKNIAALNIKPCFGEFSGQVVYVGNRHPNPSYPYGMMFEVDYWSASSGGMEIIDPDGKRLLVPFGEVQCFEEID